MKKLRFSIEIKAPREKVWNTLWGGKTFRDWANIIDEGMYMTGDLKEGNQVQFTSPSGAGVTSLVDKLIVDEFVSFRHLMDTQDGGEREKEWGGGMESYSLTQKEGVTILTIDIDLPPEQVENFKDRLPKVLERVKVLAEKNE